MERNHHVAPKPHRTAGGWQKPALMLCLALMTVFSFSARGQSVSDRREIYISWDDFVTEYLEADTDDYQDETQREERLQTLDELERLHAAPININTASRSELLLLPFLTEMQVDSIVSRRDLQGFFPSLGELQFVNGLTRSDRQWLSLFTYAGDTLRNPMSRHDDTADRNKQQNNHPVSRSSGQGSPGDTAVSFLERLVKGRHEVTTRLDIPLYKRSGNKSHSTEELLSYPNRIYLGNGLANTTRYRYKYGRQAAYGITLQKDAGEPFGSYGNRPYDFVSAYAYVTIFRDRLAVWAGDFDARSGQGLLLGNSSFSSKSQVVSHASGSRRDDIRPHTSTDESAFFRGLALRWRSGAWDVEAFFSYRRLDGRLQGDTLTSFSTDGLHRTIGEMEKRRQAGNLTAAVRTVWRHTGGHVGLTAVTDRYSHTVWPTLREYNRYYLRGRSASGLSIDYTLRRGRFSAAGETAIDAGAHVAASHTLRWQAAARTAVALQGRYFSPRFVAPHAAALRAASRVQNEAAVLVGLTSQLGRQVEVESYAHYFRFPRPTYTAALPGSQGFEWHLQANWHNAPHHHLQLRYRFRTRQQNVTGQTGLLQYVTTHRLRLSSHYAPSGRFSLYGGADVTLVTRQTTATPSSLGWMLSGRTSWRCTGRLSLSAFAAAFFTDDYASRLFAYEPQLPYAGAFPSYAWHGMKLAALCSWTVTPRLILAARYGLLHYFNRSQIGSGTQLISSPSQNDLSLQLALSL